MGMFSGGSRGSGSGVGTSVDGQVLINTSGAVAGKDVGGVGTTLLAYTGSFTNGQIPVWDAADNRFEPGTPAITIRADDDGTVALISTDRGALVTSGHATANAVSIAQAGTAGFEAGFFVYHCVTGAGPSTITPTTSTINGAATLFLERPSSTARACALIVSDGTNYTAILSPGSNTGVYTANCTTSANCATDAPTGNVVTDDVTTAEVEFALQYTIPANYLVANKAIRLTWSVETVCGAAPSTVVLRVRWGGVAGTLLYSTAALTPQASLTATRQFSVVLTGTAAAGAAAAIEVTSGVPGLSSFGADNQTAQPVTVATNASAAIVLTADWTSNAANTHSVRARVLQVERLN